jgi:hypothetical protein
MYTALIVVASVFLMALAILGLLAYWMIRGVIPWIQRQNQKTTYGIEPAKEGEELGDDKPKEKTKKEGSPFLWKKSWWWTTVKWLIFIAILYIGYLLTLHFLSPIRVFMGQPQLISHSGFKPRLRCSPSVDLDYHHKKLPELWIQVHEGCYGDYHFTLPNNWANYETNKGTDKNGVFDPTTYISAWCDNEPDPRPIVESYVEGMGGTMKNNCTSFRLQGHGWLHLYPTVLRTPK